jgi:hypothetical protein
MAYEIQLAQINTNSFGLGASNTAFGFPANTNFNTLLMSYWMCGPTGGGGGAAGIWPGFASAPFFNFSAGTAPNITLTNQALGSSGHFFQGNFTLPPPPGMLLHLMLSIDTHAQIVQVYINDHVVPVTGGVWTGSPPFNFNLLASPNIWFWNVSGVVASGRFPALADAWITNPPAFVDLSVVANRRKFIGPGFTPVDLGATGTAPFGYQPAIYMSVRPGGVATDILINRGTGGGTWNASGGVAPTFQAAGSCTLPPPPPKLALDDVVCTTIPALQKNLISLEFSDDRGRSYGNPVTQPMGEAGEYRTSLQWARLGMARDRVFRVSWSVGCRTALQGCWVDVTPAGS